MGGGALKNENICSEKTQQNENETMQMYSAKCCVCLERNIHEEK